MHLLRKVLLKLIVLALVLLIFYYYQTSDGVPWSVHGFRNQNESQKNISAALAFADNLNNNSSLTSNVTEIEQMPEEANYYNVWCIFTKVATNSPMRRKFHVFVESLLRLSSVEIYFHVISDDDSRTVADNVVRLVMSATGKTMKVQYYNVRELAAQLEDIVSVMSPHFSSKPGTYYSDALFFLSLGLHRIAPVEQKVAAMFDADTKFRKDIKDLFKEFDLFEKEALFGLAIELTPVYRHVLYLYRNKNPNTIFGEPRQYGGYPGYNSGMILFNFERLRTSKEYIEVVSKESVENMTRKYHFKGHLGDQDFYTLMGMEKPHLIHTVDCGWNRQLCTWWRDRGYADVFANYSMCDSETKLWHGNCNTPIPDD